MASEFHSIFLSNVVQFPNSASVPKRRRLTKVQREAARDLPRHPAKYLEKWERSARADAELISDIEPSAAMVLVSAIYQALSDDRKKAVEEIVALNGAIAGGRQAAAWLRYANGNFGTQSDIKRELRKLGPTDPAVLTE